MKRAIKHHCKISRILHAGYVFQAGETQIAFDPIFENPFSTNCFAFPAVEFDLIQIRALKLSAVFISHYHDDHFSLESLNLLDRATPIFMFCIHQHLFELIRKLGFAEVHALKLNEAIIVGPFQITAHPALDVEVDSIFEIKVGDLKILNVVDSWIDPGTLSKLAVRGPWDLILWPFQMMQELEVLSPSRMGHALPELPQEWIFQLQKLNPKFLIPSSCQFKQESWSWYNQVFFPISYAGFAREMKRQLSNTHVFCLDPSRAVILSANSVDVSEPLPWVKLMDESSPDYVYDPHTAVPTTAEISRHFAPLTQEQTEFVYQYCAHGLIQEFASLETSECGYFLRPRFWHLFLYDAEGEVQIFYYEIFDQEIKRLNDSPPHRDWLTEIPITKLYSALTQGEALTSLYIRINDTVFSAENEAALVDIDILQDPLVRCLFTGPAGAYQAAQLTRLILEPGG